MSMFRRRYLPQEPALIACDSQQRRPTLETSSAKTNTAEKQAFEEQWNGKVEIRTGKTFLAVTKYSWLYSDLLQALFSTEGARIPTSAAPQCENDGRNNSFATECIHVHYCLSNWPCDNHRMRSAQQAMLNSKHTWRHFLPCAQFMLPNTCRISAVLSDANLNTVLYA